MGLRALNAERTREMIIDVAIDLFIKQGYDETKLEHVAEAADVSISTLYRYFPTKDLSVLTPIALHGQMADEIRRQPEGEPMATSLGHAVRALASASRGGAERLQQVTRLLSTSDTLRSRLREELVGERMALQKAIAARLQRPDTDIYCAMTARLAMGIFEVAGAELRLSGSPLNHESLSQAVDRAMLLVLAEPPTLPQPAD